MDLNGTASNGDRNGDSAADAPPLTEEDRKFFASRDKSAARSHLINPTPRKEQALEDWARLHAKFPAHIARKDEAWEYSSNRPVDSLDKDNILRDHPEQYLLDRDPLRPNHLPPPDLLPIPDAYTGTLMCNNRVTPTDHWQDVRHLRFSIPVPPKVYEEIMKNSRNMTLVIYPKNYPEDVQELISLMGWTDVADNPLKFDLTPRGLYIDKGETTLRKLLTHNLDITAIPKRNFIRELVFFTNDEREKERLTELTMPANLQEFYDYTCRPRRTILELLRDFTGVKIPFNKVLDLFPVIRGREFSVCNGGVHLEEVADGAAKNIISIEVLAALVEYKTIIRKPRQGLCSRYLKHLPIGTRLALGLKPATGPILVSDGKMAQRPLIAVGTGTGIAPIRATIQERDSYPTSGKTLVFFGCRNRAADFHFEHEWEEYRNLNLYPAFSRDNIKPDPTTTVLAIPSNPPSPTPPTGAADSTTSSTSTTPVLTPTPSDTAKDTTMEVTFNTIEYDASKNYVQHLIRKHADQVGALMRQNPIVCVCGNAGRMPVSVRNALLDALVMSKVVPDKETAESWFNNKDNLTFWQETW